MGLVIKIYIYKSERKKIDTIGEQNGYRSCQQSQEPVPEMGHPRSPYTVADELFAGNIRCRSGVVGKLKVKPSDYSFVFRSGRKVEASPAQSTASAEVQGIILTPRLPHGGCLLFQSVILPLPRIIPKRSLSKCKGNSIILSPCR